ncbi:apolipoprotein F [Python bivittatus]|uniref:Apolipoprotein F n=1 Tax=Python bivittatus TaxID=176946 RepID=A0A9F5J1F7_PYTBI|nr:apolipoprotein F [Python bivittatus]
MHISLPLMILTFLGFLPHHGWGGHFVTVTDPRNSAETHHPTLDSSLAPLRTLLSSISSNSIRLPENGVSCSDLMPDVLERFNSVPRPAQILIRAALVLALQNAGCSQHAETLGVDLYQELGQKDASILLFIIVKALGTANSTGEDKSFAALQFNLDQLAPKQAWQCQGLMRVNRSLLHGQVYRVYRWFPAAAAACHYLGNVCAGVVTNGNRSFQVLLRDGSYFLPQHGSHSWLHQCHRHARMRRFMTEDCLSEKEQNVHTVVGFIPVVSTLYNFATSLYYASQDCSDLAKERAIEGAIDLGYDFLVGLTGGTGTAFKMMVASALKPGYKIGVQALIEHVQENGPPYPVPSNYSGPVIII